MCQYACLPAPKTVMECTLWRFEKISVDAKAVRNAVSSSALMNPRGVPALSRMVSEPRGVVLCELVTEGFALGAGLLGVRLLTLLVSEVVEGLGVGPDASVTILTPVVVPVRAGMKRVVWPFPLGIEIR